MKKSIIIFVIVLISFNLSAQNFDDLSFGTDTTFEVVSWNIEWFPKNGQTTLDNVSQIIEAIDVDILALQEINDTVLFKQMLEGMEDYNYFIKSGWYAGLTYIYKKDVVEINDIYEIYTTSPYWSAFPRSPVVMELTFMNQNFIVINNHFKCCGDGILNMSDTGDEETRRYIASSYLKEYIEEYFPNENVIVLGDLNDELTDIPEDNVFQLFIDDTDNYLFADIEIANGAASEWSYPTWPSHLDHILITNDLFDEFENENSLIETIKIDEYLDGGFNEYDENISDHRPVGLKLVPNSSININENSYERILFANYPNPFKQVTNIFFNKIIKNSKIEIYNINGQKMQSIPVMEGQSSIIWNAENYPNGIYFAKLISDQNVIAITKIVLIK